MFKTEDEQHLLALEHDTANTYEPSFAQGRDAAFRSESNLFSVRAFNDALQLGFTRNPKGSFYDHLIGGFTDPDPEDTPLGVVLSPDVANKRFGLDDKGQEILKFTKPVSQAEAMQLRTAKLQEIANREVLERVDGFGDNLALLSIGLFAELRDPLGFTSIFVPGGAATSFGKAFLAGAGSVALSLIPGVIRNTQMQGTFQSQQLVIAVLAGGTLSGGFGKAIGTAERLAVVIEKRADNTFANRVVDDADRAKQDEHIVMDPDTLNLAVSELTRGENANFTAKVHEMSELQKLEDTRASELKRRTDLIDFRKRVEQDICKTKK